MKKMFLATCMFTLSTASMAQQPAVGTVSIIPRIGVSLANLPGDAIYVTNGMGDGFSSSLNARYKAGFIGGADIDYQFMPNLSASLGVYYAQQGCRYGNNSIEIDAAANTVKGYGYSDWSTQLHYINVPLMLNGYIGPGFAIKAGVQLGFAVSGKNKYTETEYEIGPDGNFKYGEPKDMEYNLNKSLSKVNLSIPVGVSYEFSNVIIDARYNIGLTRYQKIDTSKSPKNSVFAFTAGYRFAL